MRQEILFPGNNPIGSAIIEKVDSSDKFLSGCEGVVSFTINREEELPGVFLQNLNLSPKVMDILMLPYGDLSINYFTEEIEDIKGIKYKMSVRISKKNPDNDDINFTLSFSISKKSCERFLELVEEKNTAVLCVRTDGFIMFAKTDPTSSEFLQKEVELYH